MYDIEDREIRIVQIVIELKGRAFDYKFVRLVLSFTSYNRMIDKEYNRRQSKESKPQGKIDSRGKWRPTYDESCPICRKLKKGVRKHCLTRKHIAMTIYTKMVKEIAEIVLDKCDEILSKRTPTANEAKLFNIMTPLVVHYKLENY